MNDSGLPSLLLHAAQSAAQADGVAPPIPDVQSSTNGSDANNGGEEGNASNEETSIAAAAQRFQQQQQQQQSKAASLQQKHHQQQQEAPPQSSGAVGNSSNKKKGPPLRRGKWTAEEEAYASRLIQEFKAGLLPLTDGTTLRTFLSKLLNCDPMRISKKFVGSNCIGKQVFRRRTADLNRLTPDQIQKSRAELSELERRFLERVAQTNRVKSSNNNNNNNNNNNAGNIQNNNHMNQAAAALNLRHQAAAAAALSNKMMGGGGVANFLGGMDGTGGFGGNDAGGIDFSAMGNNPNAQAAAAAALDFMGSLGGTPPPWLQPPLGYKQGMGAQMAAGQHANSRAAAAGRALLGGLNPIHRKNSGGSNGSGLNNGNNASLFAMAELQRQTSRQALMNAAACGSAQNFLAALSGASGSGQSLSQMAHNASAARLGALNGNSLNNLMLKTGFSRDQLSQLARERGMSSASLSNMLERKSSFDALMSLDFQSLQSIDNLANLFQTGGGGSNSTPSNGLKNWSAETHPSSASLSNAARRLASANNLETLMRTVSNNNNNTEGSNGNSSADFASLSQHSNANLQSVLQTISSANIAGNTAGAGNHHHNTSVSSLLGTNNGSSVASLANLLRDPSSTGLTAMRMQDGLNHRNSSVEDFLSLVAAGDIPHQDPSVLNLSLSQFQQQQQQQQQLAQQQANQNTHHNNGDNSNMMSNSSTAAMQMAQQQLLAQATGNTALANALASRSFANFSGLGFTGSSPSAHHLSSLDSTAELLQQMADATSSSSANNNSNSFHNMKRKLLEVDDGGGVESQGKSKR